MICQKKVPVVFITIITFTGTERTLRATENASVAKCIQNWQYSMCYCTIPADSSVIVEPSKDFILL